MVGRRPAAAAGGGGLILGDRQAQGACWDIYYVLGGLTAPVPVVRFAPVNGKLGESNQGIERPEVGDVLRDVEVEVGPQRWSGEARQSEVTGETEHTFECPGPTHATTLFVLHRAVK
jgi:hypothetical protein